MQTSHLQLLEREHKKIYFSAKGNLNEEINNNRVSKTLKKMNFRKMGCENTAKKKTKKTKTITSKLPN
jgi:hypothetical protein